MKAAKRKPARTLHVGDDLNLASTADGGELALDFVAKEFGEGTPLEPLRVIIPDHLAVQLLFLLHGMAYKFGWPTPTDEDLVTLGPPKARPQ